MAVKERNSLQRHGLRFRFNGFPLWDDDGNLCGVIEEPCWEFSELSREDEIQLGEEIIEALNDPARIQRQDYWTDARVYAAVLAHNGIRCPHPTHWRTNLGHGSGGYECAACQNWIVPKRAAKSDFEFWCC